MAAFVTSVVIVAVSSRKAAANLALVSCEGSGSLWVLKMDRASMDALNDAQNSRSRACSDEKTAGRTIRFNQLRMSRIDSYERQALRCTYHGAKFLEQQMKGELLLILSYRT